MDAYTNHYVELSSRLRSAQAFCEFLASGGRVWDQPDGTAWRDVTAETVQRELPKVRALETLRRQLYPDVAAEDGSPFRH
ncbi:hypothetical protein [Rhizobium sp. 007]|uniref:hypothetical protein n=1 Tax=Rhizobium sp. 007 TaxID=2785056 RepID=UPI00188FE95D|nr:hypothetical protein [Rhizobium sp. 007]QPB22745.1 hypothetical protein ISN39_24515 [Rhizobium sp. 007]